MEGFALLLGHLVGDYIVQNDWMAKNKSNPRPSDLWMCPLEADRQTWMKGQIDYKIGHCACLVHCFCYTLAVWAFSFWWMPWWGLLACFAIHFPIDRWRLAAMWMRKVSMQKAFADGPLSPWSIIVVDNTFHLLTLFGIAVCAGRVG